MERDVAEEGETKQRRPSNLVSNLFAIAAIVFGIVAVGLFLRGGGGTAPIPTPAPGNNEYINVVEALKASGVRVQDTPRIFIPANKLGVPGQGLEVDGEPAFIFLFRDAASAHAAVADVDPASLVPERLAGTPAPGGERRLTQNSNVVVLVVGGSDETWQKVQQSVASLP